MKHYDGKIIYITGGTSGLGLEAACALAARGAHVALFSSGAAQAEAVLAQVKQVCSGKAQRIAWFRMDVGEREQVLTAFAQARAEVGEPDIVIHMAGVGGIATMTEMPLSMFDRIMRINVYGTRHVVEAALVTMQPRRDGLIVLAGSMGGFVPVYGYTAYGTSKFAVNGFAQCLRYELKPLGITVACFCPGEVATPGLAAERQHTHPAAVALKRIGGTMATEQSIKGLLRGIEAGRFLIVPGLRMKLVHWAFRLTPTPVWNAISDLIVGHALRA